MTDLVHARTPFDIVSVGLGEVISLPDPEAAEALNDRIVAWNAIDHLQERSYVERGLIAVQFEKRSLWRNLIDPDTNTPFANFTAWMSCSQFMGCRRTNFEAKGDVKALEDVPAEKLIEVPKDNIKVLKQLSTKVRNDPAVLEAAKTLEREKFEEKVEREHPDQHIEARRPFRLNLGRSQRKAVDEWIAHAIEHDIAGNRDEAIVRACEMAMELWRIDEMPAEEVTA